MFDFAVTHISVYRRPESLVQTVQCPWITFLVSGCESIKNRLPDGKPVWEGNSGSTPVFAIYLPGMQIDFRMNDRRENWVIMLKNMPFAYTGDTRGLMFGSGAESAMLPFHVPLSRELAAGWQTEFERMREAYLNPTPENSLRVRLGVMNILRFMIDRNAGSPGSSPAEQLKRLIDDDDTFAKPIAQLSRACGYNADHLREQFKARYRTSPLAYRTRRRQAQVMELIAGSRLSVKEISYRTGFKHPSHFCLFFKKEYQISPGEAIRRFRNQTSPEA